MKTETAPRTETRSNTLKVRTHLRAGFEIAGQGGRSLRPRPMEASSNDLLTETAT